MAGSRRAAEMSLELNAVDNVSETTTKVEKRLSQYQKACEKVQKLGSGFIDTIGNRFSNFSVAFTNSILLIQDQIVKPLASMISNFSQAGFQLEKMARCAHLTVEQLGALSFAAEQTGILISWQFQLLTYNLTYENYKIRFTT